MLAMFFLPFLLICGVVHAQYTQSTPYSSPSLLRGLSGQRVDMAPSNPLRLPGTSGPLALGGSDTVTLSSGMFQGLLPPIPNLQLGYLYSFGSNYGAGRLTGDYLKPFNLNKGSFLFGEAHVEGWNFWNSGAPTGYSRGFVNNRVDVSLGGGYRKFFGNQALIGINGFYDTTRLTGQWYSSGSLGLQAAWLLPGSDALDLNFNWYGKLLNGYEWINTFRHGPSNYDFEAGYSHEIWNGGPDLRLKVKGYHFDVGSNLNGWTGGAELKSRDGMFVLKYEAGYDRLDSTYQTVGGYVNVGCQLENLLKGENPFTAPTPIFRSPRNLSYMANQPIQRNWNQPTAVVLTRPGQAAQAARGWTVITRYLGSFELGTDQNGNFWIYGGARFAPVPSTSLDPNGIIIVQFDYVFTNDYQDMTGMNVSWTLVSVDDGTPSGSNFNASTTQITTGPTGTSVRIPLTDISSAAYNNQSAFTDSNSNPASLFISLSIDMPDPSQTNLTLNNVVIYFNQ